jgi:quinolinate synthase
MVDEIEDLKRGCLVLAHNYQIPEIQDAADFVGDSLGLCQAARGVEKPYLLFCGVDFMAESAALLNPRKTILVPEFAARCPMAAMLPARKVREAKEAHPEAEVVLYINTLVEARAEADVVCTSANAIRIVRAMEAEEILFGPDRNLAWHVSRHCPEKRILPLPEHGYCRTHILFDEGEVRRLKEAHPEAEFLAHPECEPEIQLLADHICSTEQMVRRAKESPAKTFLIATEIGLLHRLRKEVPGKVFLPAHEKAVCISQKKNTWEAFLRELRERKNVVHLDPGIAEKARRSLQRMLELSAG